MSLYRYTAGMIALLFVMVQAGSAQEKLAQTGFEFLKVGADARASAMGEAFTTMEGGASSLFYNPAGMARMEERLNLAFSYNTWIADINHSAVSLCYNPKRGAYGVFGLSAMWVDYGEFLGTMVWRNSGEYVDTGTFSPNALAFGVGYAKALTDRFSVGGQVRLAAQSLGHSVVAVPAAASGFASKRNTLSAWTVDFGTIFQTGVKSLAFGMSVRNFSQEIEYEMESFQLPLIFKMGISMNLFDLIPSIPAEEHAFKVALDAVHPRSYPEYISLGGEYAFKNMFMLRTGYASNQSEHGLSFGFGITRFGLAIDYAYTPFGVFDNVQRFTARFTY
ncbi:MAG TPA: PorV/PorQ family protein [bacterium]|nr:PorV/PorQ family protein [bacterium]